MTFEEKEHFARRDLIALFSPTLGETESAQTIDATTQGLGIRGEPFNVEEALAILNTLSKSPGLVSLVSRLASARLKASLATRQARAVPRN